MADQHTPIDIDALKEYFLGLQNRITSAMSALDGKAFVADEWHKPEDSKLKGYGRTCTLDGGNILEKGGVGSWRPNASFGFTSSPRDGGT